MLDVHVIACTAPPHWLAQCLASIDEAIASAGFPVTLHRIVGEQGHIGRGRAKGYSFGWHPYVTCVDDDDYVLPHAFAQMRQAIESGVSAICTPETIAMNGRMIPGKPRHHLTAYRRDQIIDHTRWAACGDVAQAMVIQPDAIDLPEPAYVHRVYTDSPARVLRRSHPHELKAATHG